MNKDANKSRFFCFIHMKLDYAELWWIAGSSNSQSLRGSMVRVSHGYHQKLQVSLHISFLLRRRGKLVFICKIYIKKKGFSILHTLWASEPVSFYIQRAIVKVKFWLILLFFFFKESAICSRCHSSVSSRRASALHCGSGLLHSPGM